MDDSRPRVRGFNLAADRPDEMKNAVVHCAE